MKQKIIGISVLLFMAGCSTSDLYVNETRKVNIESSVDQKAVYAYLKKAQAHLSTAPNYKLAVHEDNILEMTSDSFQIPIEDVTLIYTTYEYGE